MYAWASPAYMLDHMTLEEIYLYHDYGLEFEENKSNILVNRIAVGLFGAEDKKPKKRDYNDTPDKEAFYKQYGDKIVRPNEVKK